MPHLLMAVLFFNFASTSFAAVTIDSVNLHADNTVPYNWLILDHDLNPQSYIPESHSIDITTPITTSQHIYNGGHLSNGQIDGIPNTGLIDPNTIDGLNAPNAVVYGLPNGDYVVQTGDNWAEDGISLDLSNGIAVSAFQNVFLDSALSPSNLSIDLVFTVTGAGAILNFHETWYWYTGNTFIISDPTTGDVLLNSSDYSVASFYHNDDVEDRLYFLDDYFLSPGKYEFSTTFNPDNEYVPNQSANLTIVAVPEVGSVIMIGLTSGLLILSSRRNWVS